MPKSGRKELDARAVGHVLAVRAILKPASGKAPSDRVTAQHFRTKGFDVSRTSLQRILKGESVAMKEFKRQVCELSDSDLADPHSRACKDTCRALYQQVPKQGHPPLFTYQEEFDLAQYCARMAEKKMARNKHQICARMLKIAVEKHRNNPVTQEMLIRGVSDAMYQGFLTRWNFLITARFGDGIDGHRRAVPVEQINGYFDNLEEWGSKHGAYIDSEGKRHPLPRQIANFDETGYQFGFRTSKCVGVKGDSQAKVAKANNTRESVTLQFVIWRDGMYAHIQILKSVLAVIRSRQRSLIVMHTAASLCMYDVT